MRKHLLIAAGLIMALSDLQAQNDTIYILNSGIIIGSYSVDDIDSIVFERPITRSAETVTDVQGNVYNTVVIGNQTWMSENLKTTRYNDGTPIPTETDNDAWWRLGTPAYSWLNNDSVKYMDAYGGLYNWYAVQTEKLCPSGWHVPDDREWNDLEVALGMPEADTASVAYRGTDQGSRLAGNSLTWVDGYLDQNEAFASSGFNAFGGGSRGANGVFGSEGYGTAYWSTTLNYFGTLAWGRSLSYQNANVYRLNFNINAGFAVRCVKD